ncbi:MAG TPA: high frequency lysogenization protein HflD [Gammaproteobacteria bacterium]|nr:high frequency lysogenization protein HflD [Gammaproteobacteria bacterium]
MQDKQLYKITLALAGITQAASLVKDLAQTGKADDAAWQASIYSLFQTDPPDVMAVYGNHPDGIKLGLQNLIAQMESQTVLPQTRYMLGMMRLQKKISHSKKMLHLLSSRLNQTKKQVDYFSLTHPTVISNLADIYQSTISAFRFRIIIWGNQRILTASENMEKIRALLLAGVRSSVLWRQLGGSRLQLIFSRRKISGMAKKILAGLPNT